MTALPAISTSLPSLGGPGGGSTQRRHNAAPTAQSSPLARSSSSLHSSSSSSPVQQQSNVGGQRRSSSSTQQAPHTKTGGGSAATSITDDIIMHHIVPIIKARNMEGFLLWLKDAPTVNLQDFAGNTPLHWAAHKGLPEFVAVLLRHDAAKDAANRNGATPLHCAAIAGVRPVVEILLQAGADPMLRNSHNRTFFDVLRSKGHTHLQELYEDLEYKLLAREAPAPASSSDSWLDAQRVGADSDSEHETSTTTAPEAVRFPPLLNKNGPRVKDSHHEQLQVSTAHSSHLHDEPQRKYPHRGVTINGASDRTDLERRVRALEEHAPTSGSSRQMSSSAAISPPLLELETSSTSHQHHATAPNGIPSVYAHGGGEHRHTVPPAGVSPSAAGKALSGNATPRHASPQRFIGPTGRILCNSCDDGSRAVATGYCEECRRGGDDCWFCDKCWKAEHTSKRTRQHRKGPVPIPPGVSATPRRLHDGHPEVNDLLPFDTAALSPEARAYLMLQQQLIAAFAKNSNGASTATRELETDDAATQTIERIQSTYFDEAMVELQDVREQLEAEVYHSQVLIDSTRVQLLEALELRHRAEIETMCWRKFLIVKRPPQVVVLYDPSFVPPALNGLLLQRSGAPSTIAKASTSSTAASPRSSSPPNIHITAPPVPRRRNATNSQAVQCSLPPPTSHVTTNTEHTGGEAAPKKTTEEGSFTARYGEDAVELVHGEKHLPDQPQMLLVRWLRGGLESWVPAYEVAHCTAVVAYLSRYDKTLNNTDGGADRDADDVSSPGPRNRVCSPMNDSERSQLSQQLAALKRTGTATGSRESTDQMIPMSSNARRPPVARPVEVDDRAPGPSANAVMPDVALSPPLEEGRAESPMTPSDEDLVKKYEQRLRELETKQQRLQKLREDQAGRLADLKNKQKLVDEHAREDVRRQYEAKQELLQEQQPEKPHPLAATSDKHAALVLQELQQEVRDAERGTKATGGRRPPPPPPTMTAREPGRAAPDGANGVAQRKPPLPPPHAPAQAAGSNDPSFEQKINRILYEQYFYNKAHGAVATDAPRPASLN